jgi:hypothetical protein
MGALDHLKKRPKPHGDGAATTADGRVIPQGGSSTAPPKATEESPGIYRCGHAGSLSSMDCPGCKAKRRSEKKQRKLQARATERASKPKAPDCGRLPPGSVKHLEWDGTLWHGTLTVPGSPEVFTCEATGEKGCFHGLHAAYVAWRDAPRQ